MSQRPPRPDPVADALEQVLSRRGLGPGMEELAALNRAWQQAAGAQWRGRAWVLGWHGAELVVGVLGPGEASRLRFDGPAIAERMRSAGWESVKGIRARVQPQEERATRTRHRHYSPEAAAEVASRAEEVDDPALRAALRSLAGRLGEPPEGSE